ncbi:ABC transporter permease [Streptomyces fuscichromogenes]|uniref:ABC transporter permease n=1 Tax=Streptomyces fuscichromogenes TaxID=1324013 RepID=A0A918CV83_9ACTN|nr:ABC transporter permease [Streptomyces fuscichromogenes]GGN33811.1 ABC transporter permease [Streptomyces fuscichromogenes]
MSAVDQRAPAIRRSPGAHFTRHTCLFALALATALLIANLALQPRFGVTAQLAAVAPLGIAAMASVPSIMSGRGGIDLSVSPLMTLSGLLYATRLQPGGLGGYVALPLLMLVGAVVGTVTGLLVVVGRLQPIVVSLAMFFVLTGLDLKLSPSPTTISGSWMAGFAGSMGPVPGGLVALAVPAALWLLVSRLTTYGSLLRSVGGNDVTAFTSGVPVGAVRVLAYALGGAMAAVGGLVLIGLASTAEAGTSGSYTLIAIAAVALGGLPLQGGAGGIANALAGAAAIYLLQSLLGVLQVSQTWLQVIYGALLVGAVLFGAIAAREVKKGR